MRTGCVALLLAALVAANANAQSPADGTSHGDGLFGEPRAIAKSVEFASERLGERDAGAKDGFYPDAGNMITGAGWISAGPGFRQHFFDGHASIEGSAALSWHLYKTAQARFELTDLAANHLTLGTHVLWQDLTQIQYFGEGRNSLEAARSQYRLKDADVVAYATVQTNRWLAIDGTFGGLRHPDLSSPTGPFKRGFPDAVTTFATDPGFAVQPNYLYGTVAVTADTRDHAGYTRSGGLYRAAFHDYSDRDFNQFSFRRYEAEAVQYIPVTSETWRLVLHGWGVFSDTSTGNSVPVYMLPALGGNNSLRGYLDYRFHDRNLLLASAESRWALFRDVDVAAFFDAGNVARTAGGLDLKKTSWGGGVRVHSQTANFARFDVGHSVEGWHLFFKFTDPFRLKRVTRRTASAPFVP